MKVRFAACCAAILMYVPYAACAGEIFEGIRFEPPQGFTAERGGDHLGYTRIDQASGTFCQIGLYAARPATATLEREFAREWQDVALGAPSQDIPAAQRGATASGIAYVMGEDEITKGDQTYRARLYALQSGNSVFSLLVNVSNAQAQAACQPALEQLLGSMALPGAKAAPAAATAAKSATPVAASAGTFKTSDVPRGKGIAGLWMGVEMPMGAARASGMRIYTRYISFYEDGVYDEGQGLPKAGYAGFSRELARSDTLHGDYWGTWSLSGAQGEAHRRVVTKPIAFKLIRADEIEFGGTHFYRVASVDGLRLDGSWTTSSDPKDPALREPGTHPVISFQPDGRFRDDGIWAQLGDNPDERGRAPGSGSYEIRDYTVLLRYDGGNTATASLTMFIKGKAQPSPDSLYLHHYQLNRMP
jgi:hypothetical protein